MPSDPGTPCGARVARTTRRRVGRPALRRRDGSRAVPEAGADGLVVVRSRSEQPVAAELDRELRQRTRGRTVRRRRAREDVERRLVARAAELMGGGEVQPDRTTG